MRAVELRGCKAPVRLVIVVSCLSVSWRALLTHVGCLPHQDNSRTNGAPPCPCVGMEARHFCLRLAPLWPCPHRDWPRCCLIATFRFVCAAALLWANERGHLRLTPVPVPPRPRPLAAAAACGPAGCVVGRAESGRLAPRDSATRHKRHAPLCPTTVTRQLHQ